MNTPEAATQDSRHSSWHVSDPIEKGCCLHNAFLSMSSEKSGHRASLTCKEQVAPRAADQLASWEWQAVVAFCTSLRHTSDLWPAGGS